MPDHNVTESAILDLEKGREAMAKRAATLGRADPTIEQITDYDRRLFGTPSRFEIDVTQPMADLRRELNTIRAELTNCLATLDQNASGNVRRHMVHSRLRALGATLREDRSERKRRNSRQPPQPR